MKNTLISIIIPIYNLADYLSKSIDSVLAQTYPNFEVIAVDDGSVDNSAELLKKYVEKDCRVKPIFKKNGGVSSARNAGLDVAIGEYVFFLDGDDWIEPDTLEKILKFAPDFDIIQPAYIESFDDGSENPPENICFADVEIFDRDEMLSRYFLTQIQEFSCNKLYKRSLIGNMRFNEAFAIAEDSEFVYSLLKKSRSIKLMQEVTYHYYIRRDSCMHKKISEKNFDVLELRDKQYKDVKGNKKLFEKFIYRYSNDILYLIHRILNDQDKQFFDKIPDLRKRVLKEKKYIFLARDVKLRFKAGLLILWILPNLFYKLYGKYKEGIM